MTYIAQIRNLRELKQIHTGLIPWLNVCIRKQASLCRAAAAEARSDWDTSWKEAKFRNSIR